MAALPRNAANYAVAGVSGARGVRLWQQNLGGVRGREAHMSGNLPAVLKNGVGAPQARPVCRRHRLRRGAERAVRLRSAFRHSDGGRGAERHQHPAARPHDRVLPGAFPDASPNRGRGVFPARRRRARHPHHAPRPAEVGLEGLDVVDLKTMASVPTDGAILAEVVMRGNMVMKGYLNNPAATEESS